LQRNWLGRGNEGLGIFRNFVVAGFLRFSRESTVGNFLSAPAQQCFDYLASANESIAEKALGL
jgi:hypothetical protein